MSELLKKVAENLNKSLVQELRDQGHYLTGSLERYITGTYRVIDASKYSQLIGFALEYAQDLETGKGPGQFGKSHIQDLFQYFLLRGLNQIEAMQAAVLTNRRHMKEGMPTKASSRFSKTGERKFFISRAWKESEQKIDSMMEGGMDEIFNKEFTKQKSETI